MYVFCIPDASPGTVAAAVLQTPATTGANLFVFRASGLPFVLSLGPTEHGTTITAIRREVPPLCPISLRASGMTISGAQADGGYNRGTAESNAQV